MSEKNIDLMNLILKEIDNLNTDPLTKLYKTSVLKWVESLKKIMKEKNDIEVIDDIEKLNKIKKENEAIQIEVTDRQMSQQLKEIIKKIEKYFKEMFLQKYIPEIKRYTIINMRGLIKLINNTFSDLKNLNNKLEKLINVIEKSGINGINTIILEWPHIRDTLNKKRKTDLKQPQKLYVIKNLVNTINENFKQMLHYQRFLNNYNNEGSGDSSSGDSSSGDSSSVESGSSSGSDSGSNNSGRSSVDSGSSNSGRGRGSSNSGSGRGNSGSNSSGNGDRSSDSDSGSYSGRGSNSNKTGFQKYYNINQNDIGSEDGQDRCYDIKLMKDEDGVEGVFVIDRGLCTQRRRRKMNNYNSNSNGGFKKKKSKKHRKKKLKSKRILKKIKRKSLRRRRKSKKNK